MIIAFARGSIDFDAQAFFIDGVQRSVVGNGASLLRLLVDNRHRVVTHQEIGEHLRGGGSFDKNFAATNVERLRQALGTKDLVRTVPKIGYQWAGDLLAPSDVDGTVRAQTDVSLPRIGRALALSLLGVPLHFFARDLTTAGAFIAATYLSVTLVVSLHCNLSGRQRTAFAVANGLTYLRPGIGIAAGFAFGNGDVARGLFWFLLGQLTDIADGYVARKYGVESARGKDWDAMADAILNGAVGVGLITIALRPPQDILRIAALLGMWFVFAITRSQLHTILDKCLSGSWRVGLYLIAYFQVPPSWRTEAAVMGAILVAVSGAYEFRVLRQDWVLRKRPLFRWKGRDKYSFWGRT